MGVAGVTSTLAQLLRVPVSFQDADGPVLAEERLEHGESEFTLPDDLIRKVHQWGGLQLSTTQHFAESGITDEAINLVPTPVALLWVGP